MNLSAYSAVPASLCGPSKPMSTKRIPQYSLSRAYCRKILASTAISRSALRRLASKCRRMILLMNAEVSCTQWSATAVRSRRNRFSKPGDSNPEMNFESAAEKSCETISGEQASTLSPSLCSWSAAPQSERESFDHASARTHASNTSSKTPAPASAPHTPITSAPPWQGTRALLAAAGPSPPPLFGIALRAALLPLAPGSGDTTTNERATHRGQRNTKQGARGTRIDETSLRRKGLELAKLRS